MGHLKTSVLIFLKGVKTMNNEMYSFVENISGVTFIVNMKSTDHAKKSTEDYIKSLILEESLHLEPDVA